MSTESKRPPDRPANSAAVGALFAAGVVAVELCGEGTPDALFPAERESVRRAVDKRVREFAAGRMCARHAMAQLGFPESPLLAAADRQPIWPEPLVGSLSHTAGFCVAVVARKSEWLALGVDTELSGAPSPDLWSTICEPDELAWCHSLPAAARAAAVTVLFAAKEAFYKCQYPLTTEWLDFHDLRISVRDWGGEGGAARGEFSVQATRPIGWSRFAALPMSGRYVIHDGRVSAGVGLERR